MAEAQSVIRGLNDCNAAQQIPRILALLASHADAEAVAHLAIEKLTAKKVRAKASEKKLWAIELLRAAEHR